MSTVQERVERGAALLDERVPGWEERIDLNELSFPALEFCVLGQLTGRYASAEACRILGPSDEFEHGFTDEIARWTELTRTWRTLIRQRRATKGARVGT